VHAERLSAMGRLLASLAHEINNPLQAIYSNIELAQDFPIAEDERKRHLQIVRREIERLMKINHSILDFTRPDQEKWQPTSMKSLLENAILLAGKPMRDGQIEVSLEIPENLPDLLLPANQLSQVCLNLILNVVDHCGKNSKLNIGVVTNQNYLEISFQDNGPGIADGMLDLIFEPFVSTKSHGSGLGLAISQRMIRQNGGRMTVKNLASGGALFSIVLPLMARATQEKSTPHE
jgi:signal transduction histidine kinase